MKIVKATEAGFYHRDVAKKAGSSFGDLVKSRKIIDLYRSQGRLSNMKLLWNCFMGRTVDTNAPADTFSTCYSADGLRNNLTQTTKSLQPYRLGHIQGVAEKLYNSNSDDNYLTHTGIPFTSSQPWTVSIMLNFNGTNESYCFVIGQLAVSGNILLKYGGDRFAIREKISKNFKTGAAGSVNSLFGKNTLITFVADGAANLLVYKNGVYFETIVANTELTFNSLFNAFLSSYYLLNGSVSHYSIESGAATPTRISEEYTLLRSFIPEIDSVVIGSQTWAVDNFRAVVTPIGTVIPEVTDNAAWAALTTPAWCSYNNDPTNDAIYGKLYNWYAIRKFQDDIDTYNAANPTNRWGWHFPTSTEFITLVANMGGADVAGGKLKLTGTTYWSSPNTGATNESRFCALPAGWRISSGSYQVLNLYAELMSVSEQSATNMYKYRISYNSIDLVPGIESKTRGLSVRLIKD